MSIQPARIHVRFSDLDVLGHVNNSVYLTYFETARIHYFGILLGKQWDWKKDGVILVKNEVEYHRPIVLHDQPMIEVTLREIGNKSFTLTYYVRVDDEICATGLSTLVGFDSEIQQTIPIPQKMREALHHLKKE